MSGRRADIQGLRGVAVLLVVLYHAGLHVPGGFTGVDVFFVISGFVITGLLMREFDATGSLDLLQFYARRIRRLLPALATMLVAFAVVGVLATPLGAETISAHTGVAASLFAANVYLSRLGSGYFDVRTTLDPLLHTWTLGVEEQFYIVFPTLLAFSLRHAKRARGVFTLSMVGGITAASFGLTLALAHGGLTDARERFAFYGSPTRAWEFGLGALLALIAPRLASLSRSILDPVGIVGLAAVGVGAFWIHGTNAFIGWPMLWPVLGTVALLGAGLSGPTPATRLLSAGPLVWIGDLSYSWYLWHWPTIVFAKALFPAAPVSAGAAALSLGPAWLSYRYIENPIRRSARLRGPRTFALAAACIALPIAACFGLLGTHELLSHTSAMKRWYAADERYLSDVRGCESLTPLGGRAGAVWARCRWTVVHPRGTIVLVGDSNAAQFTEPVIAAGNRARYDVTVASLSGCPFIDLRVVGAAVGESDCYRFDSASLAALVRRPRSIVVLANRDDRTISSTAKGFVRPDGAVTYDPRVKASLWEQGLVRVLRRLNQVGTLVVLVQPVPFTNVAPDGCAVIRVLTTTCGSSVSRTAVDSSLEPALRAERRAAAASPRTSVLSFEDDLCGETSCSTVRNGTILYSDSDHLSTAGARTLTTPFYREFTTLDPRRPGKLDRDNG